MLPEVTARSLRSVFFPEVKNKFSPYLSMSLQRPPCYRSLFDPIRYVCSQTGQTQCRYSEYHPSKWNQILPQSVLSEELQEQPHSPAAYKPLQHRTCPSGHYTRSPTGPGVSPPLSQHSACRHPPTSPPQPLQTPTGERSGELQAPHWGSLSASCPGTITGPRVGPLSPWAVPGGVGVPPLPMGWAGLGVPSSIPPGTFAAPQPS